MIEGFECLSNVDPLLSYVSDHLLKEESGQFVIAEAFLKNEREIIEAKFKEYFDIQKKEIITFNVKHAI